MIILLSPVVVMINYISINSKISNLVLIKYHNKHYKTKLNKKKYKLYNKQNKLKKINKLNSNKKLNQVKESPNIILS